ncbi:MAG: beta-hydroxyacyl-ACP dehydratase [Planctomycetaceae bacterium]|nr:beta-hydroxyacyl-ACP dehydratase [Planctomycetaceae bacterium]MCB9940340.1 beta-hydroxyacyl-ACP dehydratase [Planctomycetaceae bacterium]HRX81193.1 3-hydroxyacyl-ACP dehydratase FabZ family protein [Pirellulaceae bacterium]
MASKELIVELSKLDFENPIADIEAIRALNPQRYEMEQLTAVVYEDNEKHICVGYKDITDQEFWVRGHMPNMPLMPGVVMLEAAAQLCSYYVQKHDMLGSPMVGFGGLEDVRFRDPVLVGSRLILMCELSKIRRGRMLVSRFQGVVGESIAVEGVIKGIPIPVEALKQMQENAAK